RRPPMSPSSSACRPSAGSEAPGPRPLSFAAGAGGANGLLRAAVRPGRSCTSARAGPMSPVAPLGLLSRVAGAVQVGELTLQLVQVLFRRFAGVGDLLKLMGEHLVHGTFCLLRGSVFN